MNFLGMSHETLFKLPITPSAEYKYQIARNFGQAASDYHAEADVQKKCAKRLITSLHVYREQLPAGSILELGCGTGFITQELIEREFDRPLMITDLSPTMLEFCQTNLQFSKKPVQPITFAVMDGETVPSGSYAAIVSGFVVQWFVNPVQGLHQLMQRLAPGGVLLASFPTYRSFPEWKQLCTQLNIPYTANPLPDPDQICASLTSATTHCSWHGQDVAITCEDAFAFFKGLKRIGAGVGRSPQTLTSSQMKRLIQIWNQQSMGQMEIHYHVAFLTIQRQI